uniref:Ribosomal protein eL8/eL30/eS12/Gadd45 domain-containing protein n=1 Tax=Monodelphis domestica TaxID=13616 RepID=F7FIK6_MONDO
MPEDGSLRDSIGWLPCNRPVPGRKFLRPAEVHPERVWLLFNWLPEGEGCAHARFEVTSNVLPVVRKPVEGEEPWTVSWLPVFWCQRTFKMAAASGKGSIRKAKSFTVKTVLNNPYAVNWTTLDRDDMHFILQTLEERFKHVGLQKIENPKKKKRPISKRQTKEKDSIDNDEVPKKKETEVSQKVPGWTPIHVRKQLAIGINEVTRALEKNELLLVLVCKSVKPAMMTSHLIQLSVSRAIPACQVPRLSESIAPVIGLKCVLALGFKKNTEAFVEELKAIIPRVPSLHVPWLHDKTKDSLEDTDIETLETQDANVLETSFEELTKNKRKLVECQQDTSAVTLQPLKIKKLIPNPNKIKKPSKNKKTTLK